MVQYSRGTRRLKKIWSYILVGVLTFFIGILVSLASTFYLQHVTSLMLAFLLLLMIILVNIVFDTIGTAAAAAVEPPFHAKAADRVKGASEAVMLVRNADKVANFCGDVVGDVCGTISGAIGATIAIRLILSQPSFDEVVVSVVMSSVIAALTVAGKAAGKSLAIDEANDIIFTVGRILAWTRISIGNHSYPAGRRPTKKRK